MKYNVLNNYYLRRLQSHYPNRRFDFGNCLVGSRLCVEATQVEKVSLTDPPIFMDFVIGDASGDDRPTL